MTRRILLVLAAFSLLATACGDDGDAPAAPTTTAQDDAPDGSDQPDPTIDENADIVLANEAEGLPQLGFVTVASDLSGPVDMRQPPGDDRFFVGLVRDGKIVILENGEALDTPFLDISERLAENGQGEERGRGERGLLAFAFHPDYETNGRFFVWYADESGIAELAEFTVSADPDVADPDSVVILREYEQTLDHFGGGLQFGPDGYLWMGIGDGSRRFNAQDPTTSRGSILRLDVSTPGVALPAPDNPFVGDPEAADDIWLLGLRNPWRWSYDEESNLIFIGDVGRDVAEEINVQPLDEGGINFGWGIVEGTQCFRADDTEPAPTDCDTTGLTMPDIEVLHPEACSITGGYVYRGAAIPELDGRYLYADFCSGWVRSFVHQDGAVTDEIQIVDNLGPVVSWARDRAGELYVLTSDGLIRKLVAV